MRSKHEHLAWIIFVHLNKSKCCAHFKIFNICVKGKGNDHERWRNCSDLMIYSCYYVK